MSSDLNDLTTKSNGSASLPEGIDASVLSGKRQRRKWSKEMNSDVIRAYYQVTENGNTVNVRRRFLEKWKELRPEIEVTEGNLCDRRKFILNRNILSEAEIQVIRNSVQIEMDLAEPERGHSNTQELMETEEVNMIVEINNDSINRVPLEREELLSIAEEELRITINEYRYKEIMDRPNIPKIKLDSRAKQVLKYMNELILKYTNDSDTLTDTNALVYCAALATSRIMKGGRQKKNGCKNKRKSNNVNCEKYKRRNATGIVKKPPAWKKRLENKIADLRSKLSKLRNWMENKFYKKNNDVLKYLSSQGIRATELNKVKILADTLKQKVMALGKRLKRYNKSFKRKQQNKLFYKDQKQFYRSLEVNENTETRDKPNAGQLEEFWANTWKDVGSHNPKASWLQEEQSECSNIPQMAKCVIDAKRLGKVLKKLSNWKAPGPDKIQNVWWKQMKALHPALIKQINEVLVNPHKIPDWLMRGVTRMLFKEGEGKNPKNYRPITCLNTLYKIITALITGEIVQHLEENEIMTEEQKGCRRGSRGSKEQLVIDKVVTEQARKRNRNLFMAWIDYRKAFDSVPHSWLIEILRMYKVHPDLIALLARCMKDWKTVLKIGTGDEAVETNEISIERGLFQGDSLSPVWFCMALNPLSRMLNKENLGYRLIPGKVEAMISHLLYLDDLKLYSGTDKHRGTMLDRVAEFNTDIHMELGLNKCALIDVVRGKIQKETSVTENKIAYLKGDYKYLGFRQNLSIAKNIKEELKARCFNRVKKILKSTLNAGNTIRAINAWAIPILSYSFGVIEWSGTEVEATNRALRVMLTKYRMHHPKAATERLYLARKEGGRGLLDLRYLMDKQICNVKKYFLGKTEASRLHMYIAEVDKSLTPLNLGDPTTFPELVSVQNRMATWKSKTLHGRYASALENNNKEASVIWLRKGELFPETEGFMMAIQDGVIATRNYRKHIMKENIEDVCRVCGQGGETIQHVTSGCPYLANTEYLHRHNLTCGILHQHYAAKCRFVQDEAETPYYKYQPKQVEENESFTMYYDLPIQTDQKIPNNRPDVVVINRETREAILFDVSHPLDINITKAGQDRIRRYFDLGEELKKIRKLKSIKIIPVIISCTGLVPNDLPKYFKELNIPTSVLCKMQKSVVMETCRIVRKYLNLST